MPDLSVRAETASRGKKEFPLRSGQSGASFSVTARVMGFIRHGRAPCGQMFTQRMQEMQRQGFTMAGSFSSMARVGHFCAHRPHLTQWLLSTVWGRGEGLNRR